MLNAERQTELVSHCYADFLTLLVWIMMMTMMMMGEPDQPQFRQKQHMTQLEQRLRESELQVHGALLGRGASYGDMCMLRLQVGEDMRYTSNHVRLVTLKCMSAD